MKRIIIIGAVVFAALALVAPGLIGYAADARHRAAIEQLSEASAEDVTLGLTDFQRGWFASSATYRLSLDDPRIDQLRGGLGFDASQPTALLIESRIQHGLFAGAGIRPVLATVESDLYLEGFSAERLRIPGEFETTLYLTGAGRTVWSLGAVQHARAPGKSLDWAGGRVAVDFNSGGTAFDVVADLGQFDLQSPQMNVRVQRAELQADLDQADFGLWSGPTNLVVSGIDVAAADGPSVGIARLAIGSTSSLEDGRLSATLRMSAQDVATPQSEHGQADFEITARRLDAAGVGEINRLVAAARSGEVDEAALLEAVSRVAAAGGELEIQRLHVSSGQGDVDLSGRFDLPAGELNDITSPRAWLLSLSATAHLEIDRLLIEQAGALDPRVTQTLLALTASGFVLETETGYLLDAEYAGGLLTLNGTPLPVPLPVD